MRNPGENSTQATKSLLRKELRARLQGVSEAERAAASDAVCRRLLASDLWCSATAVLFYAPLPTELDLWPLLEAALANKTVALPWHDAETDTYLARIVRNPATDVAPGFYGIREPSPVCPKISLNQLDLALVPGLGYSEAGVRLGHGKGYYDRLLAGFSGVKCGVGYEWQLGLPIPGADHDTRLNCIVTPSRWHWVPERGS